MNALEQITIRYTNWRGETADRVIQPLRIWWGNTEWHPENQWMMEAVDLEKRVNRDFALRDIVFRADLYDAQAAEIADLRRQLAEARADALNEAALLARRLGNDAEKEADKRSVTQGQKTGLHLVRDAAFALEAAILALKGAAK